MNTTGMISVNTIAAQADFDQQDADTVTAQLRNWCVDRDKTPLYSIDLNTGEAFVAETQESFVQGFLYSAAEERREAQVVEADKRLVAAYEALKAHPSMPLTAPDLAWTSQMGALFTEVTRALEGLLDAKLEAQTINPVRASRIRSEAQSLHSLARRDIRLAMRRASRMATSH